MPSIHDNPDPSELARLRQERYERLAAHFPAGAIPDTTDPVAFDAALRYLADNGGRLQKSKQLLLQGEAYDIYNEQHFWGTVFPAISNQLVGGISELHHKSGGLSLDQGEEIKATVEILPMFGDAPNANSPKNDPEGDKARAKLGPAALSFVSTIHIEPGDKFEDRAVRALSLAGEALMTSPFRVPKGTSDEIPEVIPPRWAARISILFWLPLAENQEVM